MKLLKDLKNAIVFKVKPEFAFTPELLADFEKQADGWHFDGVDMRDGILRQDCFVAPVNDKFIYTIENKIHYARYKKVNRQIPASVVKREVKRRCNEYSLKEGKSATKKMRTEFKHDAIDDLSVHAFKVDTYIDVLFTDEFVIIFTGSKSVSDDITSYMRKLFGSLPATPIGYAVKGRMSQTVTEDISNALKDAESEEIRTLGFDVGDSVSLQGNGQVSGKQIALDSGVVMAGLEAGMSIGKVQLSSQDLDFDIDEDLHFKSIKFGLGVIIGSDSFVDDEIDGNITVSYNTITSAVDKVVAHLGGWFDDKEEEEEEEE